MWPMWHTVAVQSLQLERQVRLGNFERALAADVRLTSICQSRRTRQNGTPCIDFQC